MANFIELKWKKLLNRARLFNFIPFVDFVLVAGSMAMGDADKNSDFDVIVGVKTGRIFTVRAFCVLFFGLFGWRKTASADLSAVASAKVEASAKANKFCFSHFAASEKYRLSEPHNEYWKKLYLSLVSIYGNSEQIQKFYDANVGWTGLVRNRPPKGSFGPRLRAGVVSNGMERLLSGKFGDVLEKWLKNIQIKKIEKSLKTENFYKPRIIFNDSELEFHPDTKRIEEYINKLNN